MDVLALVGGGLIGAAALVLYVGIGRIAGISGIYGRAIFDGAADQAWRWYFLAGLVVTALVARGLGLQEMSSISNQEMAVAGLLVGLGTWISNGCTSGHGVCGISRLSTRSIVATCVFMGSAMLTVWAGGAS